MAAEKVLRWFINRITEPDETAESPSEWLAVTVSPESEKGVPDKLRATLADMADNLSDDISWWTGDEEQEIDGTIYYHVLSELVSSRNIRKQAQGLSQRLEDRAPAEGMVFLQFVPKPAEGQLHDIWSQMKASSAPPDLEKLARLKDARWCDFTKPARRMSASLYRQLLGDKEVGENEAK